MILASVPANSPRQRLNYRFALLLCYLASASVAAALWLSDQRELNRSITVLARERGALVVGLIELMRDWNANQHGVYVAASPGTPPNPWLVHPRRDLLTTDGTRLTMVNPAYMTRQLAELAVKGGAPERLRFHLTSLRPIRPDNAPDAWEAESLRQFETGVAERLSYFETGDGAPGGDGGLPSYRYMAPLRVKQACLDCHAKQGYKLGEIRGGISVSMAAQTFSEMLGMHQRRSALAYGGIFLLLGFSLHAVVWSVRRYAREMLRMLHTQEQTIGQRTRELAAGEARYRTVFESVAEAILVTDHAGVIESVNPAFCEITGYAREEVIGKTPAILRSGHHDNRFFAAMWLSMKERGHWQGDIWNRRKSGEVFVAWMVVNRIEAHHLVAAAGGDPQGSAASGYIGTFFDITARKAEEESFRHQAHHDALTGLPNRTLFLDRLHGVLSSAHRHNRRFAVLYLDLDRFKEVNDRLGHPAGDALLQQVAERLRVHLRDADTVARFGGDEFALLLSEIADEAEVCDIAQRIVSALAVPFALPGGQADISASVGVALFPEHGKTPGELQAHADMALYAVKHSGRNAWRLYDAALMHIERG